MGEPTEEECATLYSQGLTIQEVADKLDTTYYKVRKRLLDSDVKIRDGWLSQRPAVDIDMEELIRLRTKELWQIKDLARKYDVSGQYISKLLRDAGVPQMRISKSIRERE